MILALLATGVAGGNSLVAQTTVPPAPGTAQTAQVPAQNLLNEQELKELLAPIALYPDALIGLILPASTFPSDIVLGARYLQANGDIAAVDKQPWDESVKGLARYPDVLNWMNDNLEWTASLGEAFVDQPADVMNALQALRADARAAGNLVDTPQQKVVVEREVEKEVIRIVPAEPDVIYVPQYDPEIVYVQSYQPVVSPLITFGIGFAVGSWLNYDCDWGRRGVYRGNWWGWNNPGWGGGWNGGGWNRGWNRGGGGRNWNDNNNNNNNDINVVNNNVNVVNIDPNTATQWQPNARARRQIEQRQRNLTGNARLTTAEARAQRQVARDQRLVARAERRENRQLANDARPTRQERIAAERADRVAANDIPRPSRFEEVSNRPGGNRNAADRPGNRPNRDNANAATAPQSQVPEVAANVPRNQRPSRQERRDNPAIGQVPASPEATVGQAPGRNNGNRQRPGADRSERPDRLRNIPSTAPQVQDQLGGVPRNQARNEQSNNGGQRRNNNAQRPDNNAQRPQTNAPQANGQRQQIERANQGNGNRQRSQEARPNRPAPQLSTGASERMTNRNSSSQRPQAQRNADTPRRQESAQRPSAAPRVENSQPAQSRRQERLAERRQTQQQAPRPQSSVQQRQERPQQQQNRQSRQADRPRPQQQSRSENNVRQGNNRPAVQQSNRPQTNRSSQPQRQQSSNGSRNEKRNKKDD